MKTLYVRLSIGYPTAIHEDEIEVEDDATQEQMEEAANEWAQEYIEVSNSLKPLNRRF